MNPIDEQRITPEHRKRRAYIYLRQSSPGQVRANVESTRVQLSLREKAVALGWPRPVAIQDDLGISASGYAQRPGFKRMLADVAMREVGVIFCVDASRLSRNSTDWAHLFELCGYFQTLVADTEQVYDLAVPNDRLVLGIKGTVAELELSVMKTRLRTGAEAKAARGELKFIIPPGFVHDQDGQIVIDPDRRVQQAIRFAFDQFDRFTSVRQLLLWYHDTETVFPVRRIGKGNSQWKVIEWQVPTATVLRKFFEHPIYAGAYVYGRRNTHTEYVDGQIVKRVGKSLPPEEARVFISNHHEAYISWERFQANQVKIAEAKPRWSMQQNRGAIRDGLALLAGILRCGHCGRKLYVAYKNNTALYYCDGGQAKGSKRCISFGSKLIDQLVGEQVCCAVEPHSIEAAGVALKRHQDEKAQLTEQERLKVEAAQYQVDRALEQYDFADPKNRLVVDTLEQRLNDRLAVLQEARMKLEASIAEVPTLTQSQCELLDELGRDFPRAWNHPDASPKLRKRLLRAVIHEAVVRHLPEHQQVEVTIHWEGGVHTRLAVKKRATPIGSKAKESLVTLVRDLAQSLDDVEITRILNMKNATTPRDLPWTRDRVKAFRAQNHIRLGAKKHDPDLMTGQQAAKHLGISRNGVLGLIRIGAVNKNQITDFAPWRLSRAELDSEKVQKLVRCLKTNGRLPASIDDSDDQLSLLPHNATNQD